MERLTEWRGEHAAVVNHHANYIDRLAAYEDIGLTPEEIVATLINYSTFLYEMTGGRMSETNYTVKAMISAANDHFQSIGDECREDKHATELLDAEADGCLVVLPPAKVGDTAFFILGGKIYDAEIYFLKWEHHKHYGARGSILGECCVGVAGADFSDFGKTVFLTREEAEAALKGEGNEAHKI